MRKENYMIALMNKKLLKLRLPPPFPKRRFLSKAMEWGLRLALFDYVFTPVPSCLSCADNSLLIFDFRAVWFGLRFAITIKETHTLQSFVGAFDSLE